MPAIPLSLARTCARAVPLLLGLAAASPARAAVEPIRIEYRAHADCPSAPEFQEQVFARTASARLAAEGEPARTFGIEVRRAGTAFVGSLVIRETDGATVARQVSGRDCADVATVLALATALAIDPRAALAPHEQLDEPGGARKDGRDTARASTDAPAEALPPPLVRPESRDVPPGTGIDVELPSTPSDWFWRGALGARGAFGATPRASWGGGALLERARSGAGPGLSSFGLELALLQTPDDRVRGAAASFRFFLARPGLCAFALGGSRLQIVPCLGVELGAVTGSSADIPVASTRTRVWAAGELALRLQAGLDEVWFIQADGGLALPFTRYRFVFRNPDTSIHDVPATTAAAAVRIGARF